jgi:hypothetical protein
MHFVYFIVDICFIHVFKFYLFSISYFIKFHLFIDSNFFILNPI